MNGTSTRGILYICLFTLCGCVPSPSTGDWRKLDEDSFILDIPKRLRKNQNAGFIRCRGAEYSSHEMRVVYIESNGSGWFPDKRKEFKKEYDIQMGNVTDSHFILRFGDQYAEVNILTNKNGNEGRTGKDSLQNHEAKFFCPKIDGTDLLILIDYRNDKDTDTALQILKSVQFK